MLTESHSTFLTRYVCAADLNRLHSVKANKLRLLEKDRRGITDFTEWVEANQNRFKARVYGPILLEVSIKDQQHAKYLEHQVPCEQLFLLCIHGLQVMGLILPALPASVPLRACVTS